MTKDDNLFMRHPPLPAGEAYHLEIPEHRHVEDQSTNSQEINMPYGWPRDVLYDTRYGRHGRYRCWQIAKLPVAEIAGLTIPNKNTEVLNADGTIKKAADKFSFEVIHEPDPCMYPHCVIYVLKNGNRRRDVPSGIKTLIRSEFAQIAEKNRTEMLQYYSVNPAVLLWYSLVSWVRLYALWRLIRFGARVISDPQRHLGSTTPD